MRHDVYGAQVGKEYHGVPFLQAAAEIYRRHGVTLLAVQTADWNGARLCPAGLVDGHLHVLFEGDVVMALGGEGAGAALTTCSAYFHTCMRRLRVLAECTLPRCEDGIMHGIIIKYASSNLMFLNSTPRKRKFWRRVRLLNYSPAGHHKPGTSRVIRTKCEPDHHNHGMINHHSRRLLQQTERIVVTPPRRSSQGKLRRT
jgi:hypothetical protein